MFLEAQSNAKRRGIAWALTFEQYLEWFWMAPCYYCGDTARPHGLDRMNNEPFYDLTNTLACCSSCNAMKSKTPFSAFLAQVQTIAENVS